MLSAAGMNKAQPPGVEALPLQSLIRRGRTVGKISQQRVTDTGHVHTNLMSAACFKPAKNVGVALVGDQQLPVSDCGFGVFFGHGHAFPIHWMPTYGAIDSAAGIFKAATYNGLILPAQAVL